MGFDSGSVGFRLFYLQKKYDSSLVESFAKFTAPPLEKLEAEPISGWVTGRHLLDRQITDERCVIGPYVHVQLMKAEKKIPASLLRAHIKMEEEIEMRARETDRLPRKARAEIKERVTAALLPKMPPTLTGIPTVADLRNNRLVAGALSDKQIDALSKAFQTAAGSMPVLATPETAALKRKQVNANDLEPVSFTPDASVDPPREGSLGMDFLTWLWFNWEVDGGVFHLPDGREAGYIVEGPVTFFREGQGAHEAVLRKGMPLDSREAAAALLCGKKLRRAKLTLAFDKENSFTATVDADFAFRSVKLPKGEQREREGIFEERMMSVELFTTAWFTLYDRFLELRTTAAEWQKTLAAMKKWITRVGAAHREAAAAK